jgi:hypothetical protein
MLHSHLPEVEFQTLLGGHLQTHNLGSQTWLEGHVFEIRHSHMQVLLFQVWWLMQNGKAKQSHLHIIGFQTVLAGQGTVGHSQIHAIGFHT